MLGASHCPQGLRPPCPPHVTYAVPFPARRSQQSCAPRPRLGTVMTSKTAARLTQRSGFQLMGWKPRDFSALNSRVLDKSHNQKRQKFRALSRTAQLRGDPDFHPSSAHLGLHLFPKSSGFCESTEEWAFWQRFNSDSWLVWAFQSCLCLKLKTAKTKRNYNHFYTRNSSFW